MATRIALRRTKAEPNVSRGRAARKWAPDREKARRIGVSRRRPLPGRAARRFALGFRSAARAARRPRSGRCWGRGTRLPAAPGSGFRSAATAARRPRSGRGWGRGTRLPAAPGSGFRSAATAARRPRSGRGWSRGTRLPAAPGSGFRSAATAARRPRSGRGWGRGTRLPAAPGSGFRSAATAARRPRSGRGWSRGTRLPAAPGSGIESPLRAASGAQRRVPIRRCCFCERGGMQPPLHTSAPVPEPPSPTRQSSGVVQPASSAPDRGAPAAGRHRPPEAGETHTRSRSHGTRAAGTAPSTGARNSAAKARFVACRAAPLSLLTTEWPFFGKQSASPTALANTNFCAQATQSGPPRPFR